MRHLFTIVLALTITSSAFAQNTQIFGNERRDSAGTTSGSGTTGSSLSISGQHTKPYGSYAPIALSADGFSSGPGIPTCQAPTILAWIGGTGKDARYECRDAIGPMGGTGPAGPQGPAGPAGPMGPAGCIGLAGDGSGVGCTVTPPAACVTPWGQTIYSGDSITGYAAFASSNSCGVGTMSCSNGVLSNPAGLTLAVPDLKCVGGENCKITYSDSGIGVILPLSSPPITFYASTCPVQSVQASCVKDASGVHWSPNPLPFYNQNKPACASGLTCGGTAIGSGITLSGTGGYTANNDGNFWSIFTNGILVSNLTGELNPNGLATFSCTPVPADCSIAWSDSTSDTVKSGSSVTAHSGTCPDDSETRMCGNGVLSGSYTYKSSILCGDTCTTTNIIGQPQTLNVGESVAQSFTLPVADSLCNITVGYNNCFCKADHSGATGQLGCQQTAKTATCTPGGILQITPSSYQAWCSCGFASTDPCAGTGTC